MKNLIKTIIWILIPILTWISCKKETTPSPVDEILGWYDINSCSYRYYVNQDSYSGNCVGNDNIMKVIKINDSIVDMIIPKRLDSKKNSCVFKNLQIKPEIIYNPGSGVTHYIFNFKNEQQGLIRKLNNNKLEITMETKGFENDTLFMIRAIKQY